MREFEAWTDVVFSTLTTGHLDQQFPTKNISLHYEKLVFSLFDKLRHIIASSVCIVTRSATTTGYFAKNSVFERNTERYLQSAKRIFATLRICCAAHNNKWEMITLLEEGQTKRKEKPPHRIQTGLYIGGLVVQGWNPVPSSFGRRILPIAQSLRRHCLEQGETAWVPPGLPPCGLPWQPPSWLSPAASSLPGTLHQQLPVSGCSRNLQTPLQRQITFRKWQRACDAQWRNTCRAKQYIWIRLSII